MSDRRAESGGKDRDGAFLSTQCAKRAQTQQGLRCGNADDFVGIGKRRHQGVRFGRARVADPSNRLYGQSRERRVPVAKTAPQAAVEYFDVQRFVDRVDPAEVLKPLHFGDALRGLRELSVIIRRVQFQKVQ